MKFPPRPKNEILRLHCLQNYEILDTPEEEDFNSFVELAKNICETPIALISLVDENRQWFKAKIGLDVHETARDISFCAYTINNDEIFEVEDARLDKRFLDNPLVTGEPRIVFYAGVPLIDESGLAIGTLCVIDHKPRKLTNNQKLLMKSSANLVMGLIKSRLELRKRDVKYSMLLKLSKNLPGFIYTYKVHPDGKASFPYSSEAVLDIYGYTSEEVKADGSIVLSRIHPADLDEVLRTIKESAEKMSQWFCEYRVNLPVQGEKWLRGSANPEKLLDGSLLWHGFISDITETKLQEDELERNKKMATLGQMAAGIAHEINNPLAVIKMASQQIIALTGRGELSPELLSKHSQKINLTTERISKIIQGLKFFTGAQSNELQNISISELLEETLSFCEEKFRVGQVSLKVKIPDDLKSLQIECRPVEISQVILNLLNNAYDAICEKPNPWVEICIEKIISQDQELRFSVTDCGTGIDTNDLKKILTPFYTTKKAGKGTGLGLSISQKLIENHGGKMIIDTHSKNTCFSFNLPISATKYAKVN